MISTVYENPQAPIDTRQRILDHARLRFNAAGIDNVGVRDIARELSLSPGNVSYHFPKKEDLVGALLDELRQRNDARPTGSGRVETVGALVGAIRGALETQLEYRCLTESIVHVVKTWPALAEHYAQVERRRRQALERAVRGLVEAGQLFGPINEDAIARLVGTWTLITRFWLSEAGVSFAGVPDEALVGHYVALVAGSLHPLAVHPDELSADLAGVLTARSLGRA
jgi:AcrR family transcriptional regulator